MRLIDADTMKYTQAFAPCGNGQYKAVNNVYETDIDAAPAIYPKKGKWMPYEFGDYHWHKCSVCGKADRYIDTISRENAIGTNADQKYDLESVRNYCPNCGAKMESE